MIQGSEIIIIILIVALIVLGPQRIPDAARKLGGWTSELRAAPPEALAAAIILAIVVGILAGIYPSTRCRPTPTRRDSPALNAA